MEGRREYEAATRARRLEQKIPAALGMVLAHQGLPSIRPESGEGRRIARGLVPLHMENGARQFVWQPDIVLIGERHEVVVPGRDLQHQAKKITRRAARADTGQGSDPAVIRRKLAAERLGAIRRRVDADEQLHPYTFLV